ncbi:ubiquitin-like domain-containing protein [Streptomyces sp. Go40/10]|uniref:resuscitation-promoting factor n=1 Tax=Streptomyces sp. Go40/10 TaxID=2825844 RepID=UPI001E631E1F|nr:resuscitation-promoting factor [Streptomyces sp. Go40/10]UFR04015.1 ubiquitin-like domain-containing protein [Streptomyces sp. Go40/10]
MSKSSYGTYDPYGHEVFVHTAETLPYGLGKDTYRPAYEAEAYFVTEPMPPMPPLPRQTAGAAETGAREAEAAPEAETAAREAQPPAETDGRPSRRRRARDCDRPESPMRRLLPQALVVAFLAGGTTAFVAEDKAIELSVDGRQRSLHTFADDVSELLAEEGVRVGAHDMIAPAPGTELASGDEVAVRYGRPVRLTLDGRRQEVWTTARTVEGALDELGVRAEGAYLSTSRSQRIGRAGLALDVRTERAVTVMADGRTRTVRTNAATVREAVEEAGITLHGQDTTSVPPDSFPRDGQTVTVLRVTGSREVREEQIPFRVERTEDPSLLRGTEVVARPGQPGLRRTTYLLRTVNGVRQRPRLERSEVVRLPRTQVVRVGTKPRPDSVSGADHLNWQALAACESGGRPDAVDASGTYGGLYQFDTRTWHSLGGTGRPQDASAEEQTYRAKKLYVQRGTSPWPHCGARLRG